MLLVTLSSVTDFHPQNTGRLSAASSESAQTPPAESSKIVHSPISRTDKMIWKAFWIISVLLAQAVVAAGSGDLAKILLDSISTNWLGNTRIAFDLILALAGIFGLIDIVLAGLWLARQNRSQAAHKA